jgi:ligand-binding SRPBCC domain-containing protein
MKMNLKSRVNGSMEKVFNSFDKNLFEYLLPPGAKVKRFDGSKPGDIVHLQFSFPIKAEWISEITQEVKEHESCYFVDCGVKLPFGMKFWKHTHYVHRVTENSSLIEDAIEFRMKNVILDICVYPLLYLSFLPRVVQYKKYFKSHS